VHRKSYWMATVVSTVFKLLAWLWVIGAAVAAGKAGAAANDLGASGATGGGALFVILAGGAVLACTSAFFGYVLSLLRDIACNGEDRVQSPCALPVGGARGPGWQWSRHAAVGLISSAMYVSL
jgi:hypothetical protein